jgi:cold shock CspA family protein
MADDSGRRKGPRAGQLAFTAKGRSTGTKPVVVGRRMTGRIVGLSYGNSTGFIRAADGRRVFFHRVDVESVSFNVLEVGDTVAFDLVEDRLSGQRALRIRRDRQ